MLKFIPAIIMILALQGTNANAGTVNKIFHEADQRPPRALHGGRSLHVDRSTVTGIVDSRADELEITVPMPDGSSEYLTLQRMSVFDMLSKAMIVTDDGTEQQPLLTSIVTYRKIYPDHGFAVFTFDRSGNVSGMIDRSGERIVVSKQRNNGDPTAYVVAHDKTQTYTCGMHAESISADLQRLIQQAGSAIKLPSDAPQAEDTVEMKIAVEADYQFSRSHATRELAMNYITQLFAMASTIYERDLRVRMTITNVRMWETSNDPYLDNIGVFSGLNDAFINEYRKNMTAIDRDVAVCLTSRGGQGGIAAAIGGICQEDASYASADVSGSLTTDADGYTWDVSMIAHEIGHICGGLHTQSCIWPTGPLDSCVASEDGECVPWEMTRPTLGTIMSYCHSQIGAGARMSMSFHPLSRNVISAYIRSAPCMDGEALPRTARLHGVVIDGFTGMPLPGVKLTLLRYMDKFVRQVPPVDGDTIVVTGQDGSYSFSGLGYGIYSIAYDDGWVSAVIDNLPFPNSVSIADTVTRFDLRAVQGQRIEFVITTKPTKREMNLTLYSTKFPGLMMTVASPWYIIKETDTTYRYVTYLPNGNYVIVPYAIQTLFTPNKINVTADNTKPTAIIPIAAASSGQANMTAIAMGVVDHVSTPSAKDTMFVGGMAYTVRNIEQNLEVARGTVPDDGVIVVDRVLTNFQYEFQIDLDTSVKVPRSPGDKPYVAPKWQYHTGTFEFGDRRRPLIVRLYRMSVQQRTYDPLLNPTIVASTAMGSENVPISVALPFPITILDRELTDMRISQNGFVSFGAERFDEWTEHPFEYRLQAAFSVAVFTGSLYPGDVYPDSNASAPWTISYAVTGTPPNRTLQIEWKNVSALTYDVAGETVWAGPFTFQAQIHESGAIDMLYESPVKVQLPIQTRIGLRGNDLLDHQVVQAGATLADARTEYVLEGPSHIDITSPDQFTSGLVYHWEIDPTLSVAEDGSQPVTLSPSIGTDGIELNGLHEAVSVRVVDMLGTVVHTTLVSSGAGTINTDGLVAGRYTVVFTLAGMLYSLPFILLR